MSDTQPPEVPLYADPKLRTVFDLVFSSHCLNAGTPDDVSFHNRAELDPIGAAFLFCQELPLPFEVKVVLVGICQQEVRLGVRQIEAGKHVCCVRLARIPQHAFPAVPERDPLFVPQLSASFQDAGTAGYLTLMRV